MKHQVKMTVIDKKLFPELQERYCADKQAGACPCYNVGDEFLFERDGDKDHFWQGGLGTLTRTEPTPIPLPAARGALTAPRRGTPSRATSTRACRADRSCGDGWSERTRWSAAATMARAR